MDASRRLAFRRAKAASAAPAWLWAACHACGIGAGLLYLWWMALLVLAVGLVASGGELTVSGRAARYAGAVAGQAVVDGAAVTTQDSGLLPLVVQARHRWYGPALASLYRHAAWSRANYPCLIALALLAIAGGLLRTLLLVVQRWIAVSISTGSRTRLQRRIFTHRFRLGAASFGLDADSDAAPLIRDRLPVVHEGVQAWLETTAQEWTRLVGLLALVFLLNLWLGVSFVVLLTLAWVLGSYFLGSITQRRRELRQRADADLMRVFGLAGRHRLVAGFAAEDYFHGRFEEDLDDFHKATVQRLRHEVEVLPMWQALGLLLAVGVVGLAAQNVLAGRFSLTEAVGAVAAVASLTLPLSGLFQTRLKVRAAGRAAEKVFELLDRPVGRPVRSGDRFLEPLAKEIRLEGVDCEDATGKPILRGLDLTVPAGGQVAILAADPMQTRALVLLLTRFIEPTRGTVRFDGVDLGTVTLESLRSQACPVLADDLLFPDTVANNIGCGDPGFGLPHVMETAKLCHAHHFIQKLPHGYECRVGDGGFPLKTGEAFRIALARAVLRDPPLLIVEEPDATLDEETKTMLADTVDRVFPGRTVLTFPRRISTLRRADHIVLLDKGKVAAAGSHRELLESSELYRHLQYTQLQHAGPPTRV